jgi:hypothetical protein
MDDDSFSFYSIISCSNSCLTMSNNGSSSSSSFAGSLSKAFLAAALLMGVSVCVQIIWEVRSSSSSSGSSLLGRIMLSSTGTSSSSTGSHQWALDRRFGFPSAFEDSLYDDSPVHPAHHQQTNKCQPQRLHLTQATNVDAEDRVNMTLSFTLPFQDCAKVQATVLYGQGLFPEGSSSDAEVVQFAYDASLAVPGLDDYESDWIHHVTLPCLQAGRQTYWYRILVVVAKPEQEQAAVGDDMAEDRMMIRTTPESSHSLRHDRRHHQPLLGESPVHTFFTPPVAHQATSLALVGDLGQTENSTKTMHHIYAATQVDTTDGVPPVSGLVIAGDLSYSDGDPRRWESWLELMVSVSSCSLLIS